MSTARCEERCPEGTEFEKLKGFQGPEREKTKGFRLRPAGEDECLYIPGLDPVALPLHVDDEPARGSHLAPPVLKLRSHLAVLLLQPFGPSHTTGERAQPRSAMPLDV